MKREILKTKIREYLEDGCPNGRLTDILIYAKQALEECEKDRDKWQGIADGLANWIKSGDEWCDAPECQKYDSANAELTGDSLEPAHGSERILKS